MLTGLLIRALRPVLIPLMLEALELRDRATPSLVRFYVGNPNTQTNRLL